MSNNKSWTTRLANHLSGAARREKAAELERARQQAADNEYLERSLEEAKYREQEYRERMQQRWEWYYATETVEQRLDALAGLADNADDPARAEAYEALLVTMREEARPIFRGLLSGTLTTEEVPAAIDRWSAQGRTYMAEYPEAADIFKSSPKDPATARPDQRWSSPTEWFENDAPDLGHRGQYRRLTQLADAAVAAGDLDAAYRYRNAADAIGAAAQGDEYNAVQAAFHADNYQAVLGAARVQAVAEMERVAWGHGVDLSAGTEVEDVELTREQVVENAVRHAFDMAKHDAYQEGYDGRSWFPLARIRAEIDRHARQVDREPYSREEIDAAVQRLTTSEQESPARWLPDCSADIGQLTEADRLALNSPFAPEGDLITFDPPTDDLETTANDHTDLSTELTDTGHESQANGDTVEQADAARSDGPPVDRDDDFAVAARMQREYNVERAVRDAYDQAVVLAEENGEEKRWVRLAEIRGELDDQAQRSGFEPYSREEVDAALKRLTRTSDYGTTVHVIPEDAEHTLTDDDHRAAVRFGGADRHQILIEDPALDGPANDADADALTSGGDDDSVEVAGDTTYPRGEADQVREDTDPGPVQTPATPHTVDADSDQAPADQEAADRDTADRDTASVAEIAPGGSETLACSVAVSRAQSSLDKVHRHIETTETAERAAAERDEELARWHADDQAARETTAADTATEAPATAPVPGRSDLNH